MTRVGKTSDSAEWLSSVFAEVISHPDTRQIARIEAQRLVGPDESPPQAADFEAARPYLRKCLENMSAPELSQLTYAAAAALWARGAVGAARYRERMGRTPRERSFRRRHRRLGGSHVEQPGEEDD